MFNQIVVGIDAHAGQDAIALARVLKRGEHRLALTRVVTGEIFAPPRIADSNPLRWEQWIAAESEGQAAIALLDDVRAGVTPALPERDVEPVCVASPTVARGLHLVTEVRGAELIVVGSSHRGPMGRVVLGDDTLATLSGAPTAVAVAPAGYAEEPHRLGRIGVGYDGTPESDRALELARGLAAERGAAVAAMTAVTIPVTRLSAGALPLGDEIDEVVSAARERLAQLGDVEPHAAYGPAAAELAQFSETVDLLVVGSRGLGMVGRLFQGSTSARLAHTAHSPLLILPPAPGHPERAATPVAAGAGQAGAGRAIDA